MKQGFLAAFVLVGCFLAGWLVREVGGACGTALQSEVTIAGGCRTIGGLPDPICTPGLVNPVVSVANMRQTICKSGWTMTIRPPTSFTSVLKVKQIGLYGYADRNVLHYEEDHLIPLCLGGAPSDPRNLWAQVLDGTMGAKRKDRVEVRVCAAVCAGTLGLAEAQQQMARDWTKLVLPGVLEEDAQEVIDEDDAD